MKRSPKLAERTLRKVESALPDGDGIQFSEIWRRSALTYGTTRVALQLLVKARRAESYGMRNRPLYRLPRRPDAEGVASAAHSSGCTSPPSTCAGPSHPLHGPAPFSGKKLDRATLRSLAARNLCDTEIGAMYGVTRNQVAWLRRKWGVASIWYRANGEPIAPSKLRPERNLPPDRRSIAQCQADAVLAHLGGYQDITRAEAQALHQRYPVAGSAPFPRRPPTQWVPSQSSAA